MKANGILESSDRLFLISDGGIIHLDLRGFKRTLFKIPGYPGKTIGISEKGGLIYWIHSRGMYVFDTENLKYKSAQRTRKFHDQDIATIGSRGSDIIILRKNYILSFDAQNLSLEPKTIHRGDRPFIGLHAHGDDLFIHTNSTVLFLNNNNNIGQAVPVDGDTKLISMTSDRGKHFFLFKNKIVEEYDNISETVGAYYLDGDISNRTTFEVAENIAVLRSPSSIDVFFLKK